MKTRTGFVSNSSSSNFILLKKYLTEDQINAILEYDRMELKAVGGSGEHTYEYGEFWTITEDEDVIRGYTSMDNDILYEKIKEMNPPMKAILEWTRNG